MIKVIWPVNSVDNDNEACDWLEELVKDTPGKTVFELGSVSTEIYFAREDDAIAFRLRFGL